METPKSLPKARLAGAERLSRAVAELPLRYAPFFSRLAVLWAVPEQRVVEELVRARDASSWGRTLFPGVAAFAVDIGEPRPGQRARLLSFASGARFPRHRHRGSERVLVLEGRYADSTGAQVGPGQEQVMSAGSEHELSIISSGPCVAAVVEHGIDFSGPWLRWASRLLAPH